MSDSASSPAPLDVPRLTEMCLTRAAVSADAAKHFGELDESEAADADELAHWKARQLTCEADTGHWQALAAALSGLVEAGALLDRMETHVRGNPSQEIAFGMVGEDEGDVWATLTYGECSAHSEYDPSLRKALTNLLGYTAAAPALREEGDHAE